MVKENEESPAARVGRRNAELGRMLSTARSMEDRSMIQCAELLGITRQRYAMMEDGRTAIGAAELEELVRYLRIPAYMVWPAVLDVGERKESLVYIQATEGEAVHIIVGPYDADSVPESYSHNYPGQLGGTRKEMWASYKHRPKS